MHSLHCGLCEHSACTSALSFGHYSTVCLVVQGQAVISIRCAPLMGGYRTRRTVLVFVVGVVVGMLGSRGNQDNVRSLALASESALGGVGP